MKGKILTTTTLRPETEEPLRAIVISTHDLPSNIHQLLKEHNARQIKKREKLDKAKKLMREERNQYNKERIACLIDEIMTSKKQRDAMAELVSLIMESREDLR